MYVEQTLGPLGFNFVSIHALCYLDTRCHALDDCGTRKMYHALNSFFK